MGKKGLGLCRWVAANSGKPVQGCCQKQHIVANVVLKENAQNFRISECPDKT